MPRIRCNYEGCIHLEGTLCTADEIELDQELGCLTFSQVEEDAVAGLEVDDEEEEEWEKVVADDDETDDWDDLDEDDDEDDEEDDWEDDDDEDDDEDDGWRSKSKSRRR
jgi:hypothetical protein